MSEISDTEANKRSRLRWVTLGEAIAIAALIISGLGVWHELAKPNEQPVVVEKDSTIPLRLRGIAKDEGRSLEISPVENSHALQSLTIMAGASKIEVGSDGELTAKAVENALGKPDNAGAGSTDYMNMFGLVALGYMWAQMAKAAAEKLANGADGNAAFYETRLTLGKYFMERTMPETAAHLARISAGAETMMKLPAEAF